MRVKTFIGVSGPYLTVYTVLRIFRVTVCVHHSHRGDEDRDCHDHPFSFLSLVLHGRYREHLHDGTHLDRGVLSLRYRSSLHRRGLHDTADAKAETPTPD